MVQTLSILDLLHLADHHGPNGAFLIHGSKLPDDVRTPALDNSWVVVFPFKALEAWKNREEAGTSLWSER